MATLSTTSSSAKNGPPLSRQNEILQNLAVIASRAANAQLEAFTVRLADALQDFSEQSIEAKEAKTSLNAAHLLRNNGYAFYHLASAGLEKILLDEVKALTHLSSFETAKPDGVLSLVTHEEISHKVLISTVSRPIEQANAPKLAVLNMRIARLLERDQVTTAQNPFRPAVFISAIHQAWCEFAPDPAAHHLALPLLRPEVFLDLASLLQALNEALIAKNIAPEVVETFRIKKSDNHAEASRKENASETVLSKQLRQIFSDDPSGQTQPLRPPEGYQAGLAEYLLQASTTNKQLFGYLAQVQSRLADQAVLGKAEQAAGNRTCLTTIKAQAPRGSMTRADENTLELLTKIFDSVFQHPHIPDEIKELIGFLQIPVLKSALIDKNFFFEEDHPARRLIELLTRSGIGWNQSKGQADPLFQSIKRNVDRVQQGFDQQINVFVDVLSDLESYLKEEESAVAKALSQPISKALQQEKVIQATKAAKHEVAARIGTGEVVAFVETFLEKKWVSVLTIAYTVQEEKPQAVENAIQTMDELIWSVKPKITLEQRKELIARLPAMLGMLNKWLNIVKWEDADRLRFFAELAECHASIVRAPIDLSPQRQLEIAVEVAQKAAERRLELRANAVPEPEADEALHIVEGLQRGMWLEFTQKNAQTKKVKLAWISPLRSLFIFTTSNRQEAFSLSSEELTQAFRANRVQVALVGGLVDRALAEALGNTAVNDDDISQPAVA
jgi:hypothetical protein